MLNWTSWFLFSSILGVALAITLAAVPSGRAAVGELSLLNVMNGDTRKYPIVLLEGMANANTAARTVLVDNLSNLHADGRNTAPIVQGRFKILVELIPGENQLVLSSGSEQRKLKLYYEPPKIKEKVRVVYFTANDGDTRYPTQFASDKQNYRDKLDTMAKLLQTFTAEKMFEAGYGRSTFALDFDKEGRVNVQTFAYPASSSFLRKQSGDKLYELLSKWSSNKFSASKIIAIMGFTSYDPNTKKPLAHTALGGGSFGLFSSNSMCSWPNNIRDVNRAFLDTTLVDQTKIWEDSNYRRCLWANASTAFGATMHEMGHTLGLEHVKDPQSIMSRGFDFFNRAFLLVEPDSNGQMKFIKKNEEAHWDQVSARLLASNPWIVSASDSSPSAASSPSSSTKVSFDGSGVPSQFWFLYLNDPRQPRYWVRTRSNEWEERYFGNATRFTTLKRSSEKGFGESPSAARSGTIVRRFDGAMDVFIPDRHSDRWLATRTVPNGAWQNLSEIKFHPVP